MMYLIAALFFLLVGTGYAQEGNYQGVGISSTQGILWVSATVSVPRISNRATNKSCYCNGTTWQNVAPPGAFLSLLGVNVLVQDGCP